MLAWSRILLMSVTRDIVWLWKKSQSITDPFATLPRHHLFPSPQQFKTIFCNKFLLEGTNEAFLHLHKKVYFACAHKTRKSTQCKCRKILPRSTATCGSSASHTFMVNFRLWFGSTVFMIYHRKYRHLITHELENARLL